MYGCFCTHGGVPFYSLLFPCLPFFSSGGTSLILLLAEMGVMVNIGRNGERIRQERRRAHEEREARRREKTIVLDTARRVRTES